MSNGNGVTETLSTAAGDIAETAKAIVRRIADVCIPIRFRWESPVHKATP